MSDKLFFDDVRLAPGGDVVDGGEWHVARTVEDALRILEQHKAEGRPIRYASLDHDMGMSYAFPEEWSVQPDGGYNCPNGCDLVNAMWANDLWPEEIFVHSANPWGRRAMREFIAERNNVPEKFVPYTEEGMGAKQKMYTEMWESIHSLENQGWTGDYGCLQGGYRDWEYQLDKQMKLWEKRDERSYASYGDDDEGAWE